MESAEHIEVGDAVNLDLGGAVPVKASDLDLAFAGVPLTYGHVVALAGDFYGTPDLTPISSHQGDHAIQAAEDAWGTLAAAPVSELQQILATIGVEQAAIAVARSKRARPSSAYTELRKTDLQTYQWNEATGGAPASAGRSALMPPPTGQGRYLKLAVVNMDHFGVDAQKAYSACHGAALRAASALRSSDLTTAQAQATLRRAYSLNAFGDHFLTDLFASGHLRTPRRALHEMSGIAPWGAGMLARLMHDEDNRMGLTVSNGHDTWLAHGDGWELDKENADNFAHAVRAVQASVDEVAAVAKGSAVPTEFAALGLAPDLDAFTSMPVAGTQDHSPLFWANGGTVLRRWSGVFGGGWSNTQCYHFEDWDADVMLAEDAFDLLLPAS